MTDLGRELVESVRIAARAHATSWDALVPDRFAVNPAAEAQEDAAFAHLAATKQRLCDHVEATYGVTIVELANLATV